ncbi:MAG: xanthine dehydrogenase molybdopterin binding subunit [Bacteroidales bacterium]|nr:xanthine dehydrogenase molybdopterin binding subunit [Bacteroidales bacterium]
MNKQQLHDSALQHVTGEAVYVNDIDSHARLLTGHVVFSPFAHANIISYDLGRAKKTKGVHAILCYHDIPGENQVGAVVKDEVCLAEKEVTFIGQALFLIAAESKEIALKAEQLIEVDYEPLEAVLNIEDAMEKNQLLATPRIMECGDFQKAFNDSAFHLEGELKTGAQEHWYLETQSCLSIPGEGNEMVIYSSTQHPSEVQSIVSGVLGRKKNEIEVVVKRIGGAFGGKESQPNQVAAWTALLASATGLPVKISLLRDEDQIITGKRHPFLSFYKVGFNQAGMINALKVELNGDAGSSTDLSNAILERSMFHIDNAYFIPNLHLTGKMWKTNHPSNTAFRGFGAPQAMAVIEAIIDRISRKLSIDPAEIRRRNFYGMDDRNITYYGEKIENNRLFSIFEKLITTSGYYNKREEINKFNTNHEFFKKGMALTPVKFGISFTTSFLNQAGALVNIYKDGSVLITHGGVEMGQGLHTKIVTIAASELGIDMDKIRVAATSTSKVPNTSATAASSGSDLNGMAVKNAVDKLKSRLTEIFLQEINKNHPQKPSFEGSVLFQDNYVVDQMHRERKKSFKELISLAYLNQISLSATGFYKTPGIFFDKQKGKGKPFFYYAYGMAVSEVLLDVLTGHHQVLRTDILHDVGNSLHKSIDIGQIEGGFIQGVGWCTIEEIKYDRNGKMLTHSPDTYKIPTINDLPLDFRVNLLKDAPNPNNIKKSKAVGEPPFMLSFSVWLAIKDAISAIADHTTEPEFSLPATQEVILRSIEKLKEQI